MEIFYYGIDNNRGGMEIYAFNLIKNILKRDSTIKYHILTCYRDICFKKEFEELGCKITFLPKKEHVFKFYRSLTNVFKKADKNNSLIQLNVMTCRNLLLFKAAKKSKIKTIIVNHSSKISSFSVKIGNFLFRLLFRRFATKVGVSNDSLKAISNKKDENNLVINNGINTEQFEFNDKKRDELRKKYNIANDEFVVGQVGRISKLKNQIFSCRVFNNLMEKENISLHFFGNIQDQSVDKFIKKNNLSYLIKNHNKIDNTNDIYNMFDLFLFPSISEGAGIALCEALANGLNCVVSENVPELNIKKDKIIKLPLKEEKWVDVINKFRNKGSYRRDNVIIGTKYNLDYQVEQYLDLYKKLFKK